MTGVTKAAVETVAENTSDGVAAPLFYMAIGGPVLGWVYKAVNTMDSMVGYKNCLLYTSRTNKVYSASLSHGDFADKKVKDTISAE